jgi:hypothetical protein
MRMMSTPLALLSVALVCGCAAATQPSSAAPRLERDCSFRSPSTCWTVARRFPPRPPESAVPKPEDIRRLMPVTVARQAGCGSPRSHAQSREGVHGEDTDFRPAGCPDAE